MVKIIDKIVQSATEPSKNDLWLHEGSLKANLKGKWESIGGGSGGGDADSITSMMLPVTYKELVVLRNDAKLIAGQMYRITDYETMTSKEDSQAAGHPFDIIVTALDSKSLDEKASAIWSARDTEGYFANSNLPAWDVRYCLDNDTDRFDWAVAPGKFIFVDLGQDNIVQGALNGTFDYEGVTYVKWDINVNGQLAYILTIDEMPNVGDSPLIYIVDFNVAMEQGTIIKILSDEIGGKGVIYRLVDEFYNDFPYDFKNIMFIRKLTSGKLDVENGTDTFVYTFNYYQGENLNIDATLLYPNIPVKQNRAEIFCWNNVFLIEEYVLMQTTGNVLGRNCRNNTFTYALADIILEHSCNNNIFYGVVYEIYMEYNCKNNIITGSRNHIGAHCSNNKIGVRESTIGMFCENITALSRDSLGSFEDIVYGGRFTIGSSCKNLILWNDKMSVPNFLLDVIIEQNINGTNDTLAIEIPNVDYVQKVVKNSSGEIKIYCEGDLIQ